MVCYWNCLAWQALREPLVAVSNGLKVNRNSDIIALPDFCAISNPAPDLGEPKLGSEPLPLGNHFTGPDILPTSHHWWHRSCNLSVQNKHELPASQKYWSALGTDSLLLYCSVGCNSCTLRVISVHFWRLLCKTSILNGSVATKWINSAKSRDCWVWYANAAWSH